MLTTGIAYRYLKKISKIQVPVTSNLNVSYPKLLITDPDPWIQSEEFRIQIRFRILPLNGRWGEKIVNISVYYGTQTGSKFY